MLEQTSLLQPGGDGHDSPNPEFYQANIETLRNDYGASSARLENSITLFETTSHEIVAFFGFDAGGAAVKYAALPCPPYCSTGRGGHLIAAVTHPKCTYSEALAFLSSGTWDSTSQQT